MSIKLSKCQSNFQYANQIVKMLIKLSNLAQYQMSCVIRVCRLTLAHRLCCTDFQYFSSGSSSFLKCLKTCFCKKLRQIQISSSASWNVLKTCITCYILCQNQKSSILFLKFQIFSLGSVQELNVSQIQMSSIVSDAKTYHYVNNLCVIV